MSNKAGAIDSNSIQPRRVSGPKNIHGCITSNSVSPAASIILPEPLSANGSQGNDQSTPGFSTLQPAARLVLQNCIQQTADKRDDLRPATGRENLLIYLQCPSRARMRPKPKLETARRNLFKNPLLAASLKPQTQTKYSTAVLEFLATLPALPDTAQELDEVISEYILAKFRTSSRRGERTKMGCLVAGFPALYPGLKGQLQKANRCLAGWDRLVPSKASMPLTRDLMKAFVVTLIRQGELQCAMAIAIAWAGYLRGNEVLNLKWKDIGLAGDPRLTGLSNAVAGINIRDAKTGINQFVPISDRAVIAMLHYFSQQTTKAPEKRLFDLSYKKYLQLMKTVSVDLGLGDKPLTTHSTRIGGALHDYTAQRNVKDIAITGRWESIKTLRRYLTIGRGWHMTMDLSETSKNIIANLNKQF